LSVIPILVPLVCWLVFTKGTSIAPLLSRHVNHAI
jgi:hypothetical protein